MANIRYHILIEDVLAYRELIFQSSERVQKLLVFFK